MTCFKIIKILIFLLFISCSEKENTFSANEEEGCFVFVSSSVGNDENDGSKMYPVRTIKKAFELGDSVRLKAGDKFVAESTLTLNNQYVGRYGDGDNPIISGYKRPVDLEWFNEGNNIWSLNLSEGKFEGVDTKDNGFLNNIGCIHEWNKDIIHGYRVRYKSELAENWDYWQTENNKGTMSPNEFDVLYLYYEGDANSLSLEFSTGMAALKISDSEVNGVDFEGFGFGVSGMSGTILRNMKLDVMGGMLMIGNVNYGCYGNGIEFYVWKDIQNCLIENCIISRCYDSACTIQAWGCGQATPRNIIFRNNLLYNNCQGWEDFLRNDDNVKYENCIFEKNVVLNSGDTGWRYPTDRFKYCHVLGNNTKGDKGMIIRNNKFVGGNFYCSGSYNNLYRSNKWEGNICYLRRGEFLIGEYMGLKDIIRVPTDKGDFRNIESATEDAIQDYRYLTGDMTTKFVIVDEQTIESMVANEKIR